jgi:hypothetical protein
MDTVVLRAHFDGKQILLDEPFDLEPDMELVVTVRSRSMNEERDEWTRLSMERLALAYADDEPEYSLDSLKEANPEYEGR